MTSNRLTQMNFVTNKSDIRALKKDRNQRAASRLPISYLSPLPASCRGPSEQSGSFSRRKCPGRHHLRPPDQHQRLHEGDPSRAVLPHHLLGRPCRLAGRAEAILTDVFEKIVPPLHTSLFLFCPWRHLVKTLRLDHMTMSYAHCWQSTWCLCFCSLLVLT